MPKKVHNPPKPVEVPPAPGINIESDPDRLPELPQMPDEDPDIIPDEEPFETPPYEVPKPGEGP